MTELTIEEKRASNLWEAYVRKLPQLEKACRFEPRPDRALPTIGGLDGAKEEILTYACALTHPEVYARWGTAPPTGLLLIGPAGSGKVLLVEALATETRTSFLEVNVPRLILQLIHAPALLGELLGGWAEALSEMTRLTVYFSELDFAASPSVGGPRQDLAMGPILDFLLEIIDRTMAVETTLVVGSTSRPDSLSPPFIEPGRFERIVEVVPVFPADAVAALEIHSIQAEKRAGRTLFEGINWETVVGKNSEVPIGEWVRILHAVLRKKARCDAANEPVDFVTTKDFRTEVERVTKTKALLPKGTGRYL
jgi:ATP-dependent 26S proteasome regulatory subunit